MGVNASLKTGTHPARAQLIQLGVWEPAFFRWSRNLSRKGFGWLVRKWCGLTVMGQAQVAVLPQCILVPTHASHLDFWAVLEGLLPEQVQQTYIAAAADHFYDRVGWRLATRLISYHNFPINRRAASLQDYRQLREMLNAGLSLLIFAQGTRTRDGGLLPFKPMAAMLAADCNVPLVPVVIKGTFEALPAGRFWPRRNPITVCFGEPIMPVKVPQGSSKLPEVAKQVNTELTQRMERMWAAMGNRV